MERDDHGALAHVVAAAGQDRIAGERLSPGALGTEADVADRLLLGAAVGARDAGDRSGHVRAEALEGAVRHRLGDLRRDRAPILDQPRIDPEEIALGLVRIDDDTATEPF